ncbi:MAG: pectate lyase [Cruoricaptor ignavus]|nr:pectate lyase [Cruoricaptor ignavus]
MKKFFLPIAFSLGSILLSAQSYYYAEPQGYGAETTGGGNATPIIVEDYQSLKEHLSSEGSKVILVSGEIKFAPGDRIRAIVKDKTLIGLPGAKFTAEEQSADGSGILALREGSKNVIIRNLTFVGPGAWDINGQDNLTIEGAKNVWIDHCDFQDGQDGNLDFRGNTDNITVSWTKFSYLKPPKAGGVGGADDHRFSNLVGANAKDAPEDGHFSITWQNVYWGEGTKERMPRARNAQLHILNSYWQTSVSGSRAIGLGGGINNSFVYVQNSHFTRVDRILSTYKSDGGATFITFDGTINGEANIGMVPTPRYSATIMPAKDVRRFLTDKTCGAGATLDVSISGEIKPMKCTNTKITK